MKRRINRYKRGTWTQYILVAMMGCLLILAGTKAVHIIGKVNLVKEGLAFYEKQEWIRSEETLQQARGYGWFYYKEKEVHTALEDLVWITNYKEELEALYKSVQQSEAAKDYETFNQAREAYERLGFHSLKDWKQDYLLEKYPMGDAISSAWVSFKGYMQSILNSPTEDNYYNWAKEKIFDIPEAYFSSDKEAAILKLFKNCDTRLYEKIMNHPTDLETMLKALNEIYETNTKYGYDTAWLTDGIKHYMKEVITEHTRPVATEAMKEIKNTPKIYDPAHTEESTLAVFTETKTQIDTLIVEIKAYRKQAHTAYWDESIEEMVTGFLKNKEKEIEVLIGAHYYEEAVSWYEHLKELKDYREAITRIEQLKVYEEPQRILDAHTNQYAFYQIGENGLAADKYLITANLTTSKLEIYRFVRTAEKYARNYVSARLLDLGLNGLNGTFENISVSGDLMLIRLPSEQQQVIKILQVEDTTISVLFESAGETITVSEDLKTIEVKNPEDKAVPLTYSYQYDGESYVEQELSIADVSLSDLDLGNQTGEIVRFECYVPENSSNAVGVGYNYFGNTYFSEQGADLELEEGMMISEGRYTVIGEVTGVATHYNEALEGEVIRPTIRVLQIERQ